MPTLPFSSTDSTTCLACTCDTGYKQMFRHHLHVLGCSDALIRQHCLAWPTSCRAAVSLASYAATSATHGHQTLRHGVPSAVGAGSMESFMQAFERNVMDAMATATSRLIISAVTQAHDDGEICNTHIIACVNARECAQSNAICRGQGIDNAIPCCGDDSMCIRRTETESRCRSTDLPVPSFWLGGEDVARVCDGIVSMVV